MIRIFKLNSGEIVIGRIVKIGGREVRPDDSSTRLCRFDTFDVQSPFAVINTQSGITIVPLVMWAPPPKEPVIYCTGDQVAFEIPTNADQQELIDGYTKLTSRIDLSAAMPNVVQGDFRR